jgi:uncharacterized protein YbjQ (UPF0145 family)
VGEEVDGLSADDGEAWEVRGPGEAQLLRHRARHKGERTMIVTTMNDIPGYEVDEVFGEVMGLTVRSRNVGSQIGAGLKSLLGGELKGMTKALIDSREQVRQRMIEEAESHGANAIIAMRFDTSEMGSNWTEICAYGTAVKVHKS